MKVLITGAAGFIGYHLSKKFLEKSDFEVVGIDNLNNYYDPQIKYDRLKDLNITDPSLEKSSHGKFTFYKVNLSDKERIYDLFESEKFDVVINLAAQAGVRYSLINPHAYTESNIVGFLNILEGSRKTKVKHLIYASSSSVYGLNTEKPFSVDQNVDHPISLYAASKKSNELMAHTYSHLFGLPTTGLRFFTVYGPFGRPDMALFMFTRNILNNEPIDVFNNGKMSRDFTYVDDIVESIFRLSRANPPTGDPEFSHENPKPSTSSAPYRVFNIGNNSPVPLMDFVHAIEDALGKKAEINYLPMQPGDVPSTYADVQSLFDLINFKPETPIKTGIQNFINWYRSYYKK